MNRFQWDLRYPEATEVNGFYPPAAAGGMPDVVDGPVVVPGTYRVELEYGGRTMTQSFKVMLDPRLKATPTALEARLALGLKIHKALDSLDTTINEAIAERDRLQANAQAGQALSDLNAAINGLVQMDIHASEGSLLHETKLRSHLAYLAGDIDLAYTAPTAAQQAVFTELSQEATAGEQKLRAAIAEAKPIH